MSDESNEASVDVSGSSFNDSKKGGKDDEQIYSLLFAQCDTEHTGWAVVDDLIEFIRKMLSETLPNAGKNEDVYDSDDSIHEAQYNLDLLRCMLNTHAVDGEINSVTYQYVIGKWVKDIRSRSPSPSSSGSSKSSDEREEEEADGSSHSVSSLLQESFETTGGGGVGGQSSDNIDPVQMMNSLADMQLEAKRLKERNEQLLLQMESSEENMRTLQLENRELNAKIKSQQHGLAQLDTVKEDNAELAKRLIDGENLCLELKERIENLQQELNEMQGEISHLQNQLTASANERDELLTQTQTLQQILNQKEDQLCQLEEEKMKLESCLEDQHQETESLQSRLTTTNEAVEELKLENSGLQQQINEKNRFPISSTPYRPLAPSLHEELANSDLANGMSPVGVMNSSMEELMDSLKTDDNEEKEEGLFEQLASSRAKFEEKAKLIEGGLTELIDTPLTTLGGGDRSRVEGFVSTSDEMKEMIETSLRKVETKKKREQKRAQKLSEELKKIREENMELRNRCNDLERQAKEQGDAEGVSSPGQSSSNSAGVLSHQSTQTICSRQEEEEEAAVITSSVATQTVVQEPPCMGAADDSLMSSLVTQQSEGVCSPPSIDSAYASVMPTDERIPSSDPQLYNNALQEEIIRLREQLQAATADKSHRPVSEHVHSVGQEQVEEGVCSSVEDRAPETLSPPTTTISASVVRKRPQLEIKSVLEESIITHPQKSGCLSLLGRLLFTILRASAWLIFFLLMIFLLVIVLVGVNSTLARCGGRLCNHSPLHMLLGQNLDYNHAGDIPL